MTIKLFGRTVFESADNSTPVSVEPAPTPQAEVIDVDATGGYGVGYNNVLSLNFDGEKDLGEMGVIKNYRIDHAALRLRGHQLFLESDVCQALFNRSAIWGIGSGLKLQASPQTEVLESEKINIDAEEFNESIEARFGVYASTSMCDYSGLISLHEIANEAWVNSDVGGDVLIIMRLINGMPKVQLVDGCHIQTPMLWGTTIGGNDIINPDTKNRVRHGVEIDGKGRHVAYFVYNGNSGELLSSYERIACRMDKYPYSETARLIYGLKYRIDNVRGIPLITAVMETASKMARYREATIGTAEELAKITLQVVHDKNSTGEPIQIAQMTQASGFAPQGLPTDSVGNALANKVIATTNKQTFNNPIGAKIEPINKGDGELNFKDFYSVNFDLVCAVAGYPPEVIMSKYNSNYSASRAAIKDFEHTLKVKRAKFAKQFYQVVYNFCLDVWALSGAIDAPGYLSALASQNEMALAAYRNARWAGDAVPHIDPYKEVQAIRAMLPEDAANVSLITLEQAVEELDNGDYNDVSEQFAKEWETAEKNGVKKVEPKQTQLNSPNGNPRKSGNDD